MKDLKEIQIEIKKELGGASLNHLLSYLKAKVEFTYLLNCLNSRLWISFEYSETLPQEEIDAEFEQDFILLNNRNQALNIFGQSEEFQRNLYDAIQFIKNINNK
jgi:hypothetical protein